MAEEVPSTTPGCISEDAKMISGFIHDAYNFATRDGLERYLKERGVSSVLLESMKDKQGYHDIALIWQDFLPLVGPSLFPRLLYSVVC